MAKGLVEKIALKNAPVKAWLVADAVIPLVSRLIRRVYSVGRVGFAPLVSYSYEEDIQAARVPLQIYAWAITRVRTQLRDSEATDWIRFKFVPPQFYVSTPARAEFVRRLFRYDVLLWGSYSDSDKGRIWLNVQQNLKSTREPSWRRDEGIRFERELFPEILEIDAPAVAVDQNDPWDAYTVLLVVVILILQNRSNRRKTSPFKEIVDRLYWVALDTDEILTGYQTAPNYCNQMYGIDAPEG